MMVKPVVSSKELMYTSKMVKPVTASFEEPSVSQEHIEGIEKNVK